MDAAATRVERQVAVLSDDLSSKVAAENRFYDQFIPRARDALVRDRKIDLRDQLTMHAREFAAAHPNVNAGAPLAKDVNVYMEEVVATWTGREKARQDLQAELVTRINENRRKLELSTAKMAELQAKLRVLGAARSDAELAQFVFNFGKEVADKFNQLEDDAEKAAAAAAKNDDAQKEKKGPKKKEKKNDVPAGEAGQLPAASAGDSPTPVS